MKQDNFYMIDMNGKRGTILFNPGWGEIPEWYVQFDNGESFTFTDMTSFVDHFRAFNYMGKPEKLIENNWGTVANFEDVVYKLMKYVEYNDDNKKEDIEELGKFKTKIADDLNTLAHLVVDSEEVDSIVSKLNDEVIFIKRHKAEMRFLEMRVSIANRLGAGQEAEFGWNNSTFAKAIREAQLNDTHNPDFLKTMDILKKDYPEFLERIS